MKLKRKTRGVTLVELLVVGVMTGMLGTAMSLVLLNFSSRAVNNVSTSDVQGDIQGAVSYINTDLRQARYIYRQNGIACPAKDNANPNKLIYCAAKIQQGLSVGFETGNNALINEESNGSGSDISIANLANKNNAKIELAFWIRTTKVTSPTCTPFASIPQGNFLSVPTAQLTSAPFSESGTTPGICNLVAFGTTGSVPAYKFVIYYSTTPPTGSSYRGPRVLYRWESGAIPIAYPDFGYSSSTSESNLCKATPTSTNTCPSSNTTLDKQWVFNPPTPTGLGAAVADFLAAANPVSIANSPSNPQSVTVSIQGSMDNVQGNVDAQTKTASLTKLLFSATTFARNICSPGVACPVDPQ